MGQSTLAAARARSSEHSANLAPPQAASLWQAEGREPAPAPRVAEARQPPSATRREQASRHGKGRGKRRRSKPRLARLVLYCKDLRCQGPCGRSALAAVAPWASCSRSVAPRRGRRTEAALAEPAALGRTPAGRRNGPRATGKPRAMNPPMHMETSRRSPPAKCARRPHTAPSCGWGAAASWAWRVRTAASDAGGQRAPGDC
mmetsp:Transcript_79332/g.220676  ORF Transcript_79332/g.220676 Transcript_79332/m.220676 type:complete len:202 (+) Transcript_79332:307-912(+)